MSDMVTDSRDAIVNGHTALGIELGSTRIKAVLAGPDHAPIAVGSHDWENQFINRIWTYSLDATWTGLQQCYAELAADVQRRYDVELTSVGALGVSAMMHGYLAFDAAGELLTPFRTWRNTYTSEAAASEYRVWPQHPPSPILRSWPDSKPSCSDSSLRCRWNARLSNTPDRRWWCCLLYVCIVCACCVTRPPRERPRVRAQDR